MKKFLAILLAAMLVLSMTAVAFADDPVEDPAEEHNMGTVVIKKNYEATNTDTTSPAEVFAFDIAASGVSDAADGVTTSNMPVPKVASVGYDKAEAGSTTKTKDIVVTLPVYTSVGRYTYTITETAGTTAGVTYYSTPIKLLVIVTVANEETGALQATAHVYTENTSDKKDNFPNVYSAGSLAVNKQVTGNLGDREKEFNVTVEFTAPEGKTVNEAISYTDGTAKTIDTDAWVDGEASVTITLKHDETVTFTNIPYGVTYTVVEEDYTSEAKGKYDAPAYTLNNASVTAVNSEIDSASDSVVITNNKGQTIDTGITTDTLPYVLLMGIVLLAGAAMIIKRRAHNN